MPPLARRVVPGMSGVAAAFGKKVPASGKMVANGVPRVELIGPERLRELEPHAAGLKALHSPETAVVDFSRVAGAYADDLREGGGERPERRADRDGQVDAGDAVDGRGRA